MVYRFFILLISISASICEAKALVPWEGVWKGSCEVTLDDPKAEKQILGMELKIGLKNESTYSWVVTYEGQPARNYEMVRSESDSNNWVLDEKNGIFIDKFYEPERQTLTSLYSVNGRFFSLVEKVEDRKMTFESRSFFVGGAKQSGIKNTNIVVGSHQRSIVQVCALEKQVQKP